jgi:hypothetical protein
MERCRTAFAGNKIDFAYSFPAYPASAGWAASVVLKTASARQTIVLIASGDSFVGSAPAATTEAWAPGVYDLYVLVTKGSDRQTAEQSELIIQPDPAGEASATALEQDLVRIDAAISAVLNSEGVQSYQIQTQAGMRQVQRMSLADLRAHRSWLVGQIDAERVKLGQKRKNRRWRSIGVRFPS